MANGTESENDEIEGADGGAIYVKNANSVYIENSIFSTNTISSNGGALYVSNCDKMELKAFYATGNRAIDSGGAIYSNSTDLMMEEAIINGNLANFGGSLFLNSGYFYGHLFNFN